MSVLSRLAFFPIHVEFSTLVPLTIGLFSAVHCVGMCGSIIGALSMSLPPAVRENRRALLRFVTAYSLGRITSYSAAGALIGLAGSRLFDMLSPKYGHTLVQGLAALLLIGIGLYLAGWFPRFAGLERIGSPLWRRLEPLGQRLLPVRSVAQAFGFGIVWGWLPCGLVYSTLLWSASAENAVQGALYMALFGLGTLPAVMTAGLFTGWITRFTRDRRLRMLVGLLLILMALLTLWFDSQLVDHGGHVHQVAD